MEPKGSSACSQQHHLYLILSQINPVYVLHLWYILTYLLTYLLTYMMYGSAEYYTRLIQRNTVELSKIKAKWLLYKREEIVVNFTHFFINMELGQPLTVIQLFPLGIDWYKFWILCSEILHRTIWGTSSCLRGDGGGKLLLTLISKLTTAVRWYWSLATALAREGGEAHLHAPQIKAELFWLGAWAKCHLAKLRHC